MKSRDRVLAALNTEHYDRVPVGPFIGYRAAEAVGISLRDYYTKGKNIARAQYALQQEVGHDIMITAADTYYISEAFGMKTRHYENALPTALPLFSELKETRSLKVPDPEHDGRMPVYLEAADEMKRLVGDDICIRGTGTGPFSLAAYLFGEAKFLMMLADFESGDRSAEEAKLLHLLLEITSDTTIAFLKAQINRGVDLIYMGDSFASAEMISPDYYRKYAFPYHKKVFDTMIPICRERGAFTLLHICGDNRSVLRDFQATGVDIIEIDQKVDIGFARTLLGPEANLIGNLDPSHTLLRGTPDEVYSRSREAIQKGVSGDGGAGAGHFILGSGCFVPTGTPVENLKQMVRASRDLGNGFQISGQAQGLT